MNNTKNLTLNSQLDYWNGQKKTTSRNGKGMNPRCETGSTRGIQTSTFRNPINAPPVHLTYTKNVALKELCQNFALRNQKLFSMQQTRKDTTIQRWVNHSRVNFFFANWMVVSYLQDKPVTITQLVDEMHITRTTARKLIADWLSYGWANNYEFPRDKRKLGYVTTSFVYDNFASYIEFQLSDTDYGKWQDSYRTYLYCTRQLKVYDRKDA